jgi:hypothetical protein
MMTVCTNLTLEDDLTYQLVQIALATQRSFNGVLNEAVRRSLAERVSVDPHSTTNRIREISDPTSTNGV